jgi:phosphoadenosine phosphosulfate reductase
MSLLLTLDRSQARISGEAPVLAPSPRTPANDGHGDVRKKIVPVIKPPAGPSATEWEGGLYQSISEWLDAPQQGGGVLLQPADDVRVLEGRLETVGIIAVDFPRIGDGRGYSHAFWLRNRLGYSGPLRALGAVTADQVFALTRVGFDSIALRADQAEAPALGALQTFTMPYLRAGAVTGSDAQREAANFEARIRLLELELTRIADKHEGAVLASSLSAEDTVVTDAIARLGLPLEVLTLETGRLHAETVALIDETEARYGISIARFRPDPSAVAAFITAHGENGFYDGVAQRKLCCGIRKIEPLNRALAGRSAWITGQRREQSITRGALGTREQDAERGIAKYNPLADWSWADVLAYAARFDIPMNALYARGYVSIGCEPCTKAIRLGENPRAGRWWWEDQDNRECGLHTNTTTR